LDKFDVKQLTIIDEDRRGYFHLAHLLHILSPSTKKLSFTRKEKCETDYDIINQFNKVE
jgi:hypothetical protein